MTQAKKMEISELSYYQGQGAIPGIKFRMAAKDLGVTAWGMNVLQIEAGCTEHPEHDHINDGQEEVYVVLNGSGTLRVDGKDLELTNGSLVRVGPTEKRKILAGAEGITVLAIGATPGKAYEPRR